jgi:hypothetical protein
VAARHLNAGERDRDALGRPRNARPRDRLGRPLPHGSTDSGRQAEGVIRTPQETVSEAQRLLDDDNQDKRIRTNMTLSLGGAILSGQAISLAEYWEEFEKAYPIGLGKAVLSSPMANLSYPSFMHLRDGRLWNYPPKPIPRTSEPGVLWRVAIASVDSWTLGTLSATMNDSAASENRSGPEAAARS